MFNNPNLPLCPFKANMAVSEDVKHCDGNLCAWFIREPGVKINDSDVGQCAMVKLHKNLDNLSSLMLRKF